jgi:hypothetical protein
MAAFMFPPAFLREAKTSVLEANLTPRSAGYLANLAKREVGIGGIF